MRKAILITSMLFAVSQPIVVVAETNSIESLDSVKTSSLSSLFSRLSEGSSSKNSTAKSAATNVLTSLLGKSIPLSEKLLFGKWKYEGASCVLESEKALANIGGTLATSLIEGKLNEYLSNAGLKSNDASFSFDKDGKCTFLLGKKTVKGTYKLNAEDKKITFTFYKKLTMTAFVSYNVTTLDLIFDADKILALIQEVAPLAADYSSSLSTASSLLSNYNGMMLGVKLKK